MHHYNYSKKDMLIAFAVSLAVMVIAAFRLTAGTPQWGDDPSAYMNEGIAIAEGEFWKQAEINYFYHPSPLPSEAENGRLIYVWGYPLQLALINRLVGFDRVSYQSLIWYKIPNLLCEGVLALTVFLLFRRRFSVILTTVLTLLFGLNDEFLRWVNITEPDLWLMAVGLASFLLMECYTDLLFKSSFSGRISGNTPFKRAAAAFLYGLMLWYAHELRLNGITILLACVFGHMLYVIGNVELREKKSVAWHLLPYAVFVVLTWGSEKILAPATGNMSDFTEASAAVFFQHCLNQLFALYYFVTDLFGLVKNVYVIRIVTGILLLLCCVGSVTALRRDPYLVIFMLAGFLVTATLPYGQGIRYLFNILPVLMLCIGYGAVDVLKWAGRGMSTKWASFAGMIFFVSLLLSSILKQGSLIEYNVKNWRKAEGPVYSTQAIEIYRYIQNNIPENKVIAFHKPRALYLNTQRLSFAVGMNGHTLDEADYALFIKSETDYNAAVKGNMQLMPMMENDEFILAALHNREEGLPSNGAQ